DAIAEMAEEHRADRPRDEGDAEGQEGVERLRARVGFRKEGRAEHQRGGRAIDVEIIEFDRRADEAGERDAADTVRLALLLAAQRGCHPWAPSHILSLSCGNAAVPAATGRSEERPVFRGLWRDARGPR